MTFGYKNINQLLIYNNNLKINNEVIDLVVESIKDFGFINPIIINSKNVVICGVTRLYAAKILNLLQVPCIVIDYLTEEQEKIYRLVDNKVNESSYWNYVELDKELSTIDKNLFKYDLVRDDTTYINIDNFFEDADKNQLSLF